jgi:hypothetical protein
MSVIMWRSVLFVEETSRWQTCHIMLYRVHLVWAGFKLTTLVAIGTDCIGSYKSNYHKIMTMTNPDDGERSWLVNHVKEMLHFTASSVTHDWWCSDALQLSPVAVQMFEIQELSWVKITDPIWGSRRPPNPLSNIILFFKSRHTFFSMIGQYMAFNHW